MNKNFKRTSLLALMSIALMNYASIDACASVGTDEGESVGGAESVVIGKDATSDGWQNVVIGMNAKAGINKADGSSVSEEDCVNGSIVIGHNSEVFAGAWDSIALGKDASSSVDSGIALGRNSKATRSSGDSGAFLRNQSETGLAWISNAGAVSFGSNEVTRQITGVAAGSADTDAVNVAQLKALKAQGDSEYQTQASARSTYLSKTDASSTYVSKTTADSTYAQKSSLNSYVQKTAADSTYLNKTDAQGTYLNKSDASSTYVSKTKADDTYATKSSLSSYATADSLSNYAAKADHDSLQTAHNDLQAAHDILSTRVTGLQDTLSGMDADTLNNIKDAVDNLGNVDLQKIQETVSKLDKLPQNGLLTVTTTTGKPANPSPDDPVNPNPDDPVNPNPDTPDQPSVMTLTANDEGGNDTGGDIGGEPSAPDTNKEATLGVGGKLNFVNGSNVLANVEGDEEGNVNVKLDLAQDATLNTLTATGITTETLQATTANIDNLTATGITTETLQATTANIGNLTAATISTDSLTVKGELNAGTIKAQDVNLTGNLTSAGTVQAANLVATTAVQAPSIHFTGGADLTYSGGRLQYTTAGDAARAGGETFSVATTQDGISFGADEGEAVKVNLDNQSVAIKGGDQYITTSVVANENGSGATVSIKMTDEFKNALSNNNSFANGLTIGAKDGYGEIRVQQGNVDMGGNRIQNVGTPVAAGDAANKHYVDSQVGSLRGKINDMDKDLRAGVAMAMAVGNLPQAYMPGKSILGVSAGTYHGQGGFALGLSHAMENRAIIFKGAASVDTRGNFGGTLSAGYQF